MSGEFEKDICREGNLSRLRDGWDEIEAEEKKMMDG